MAVCPRRAWLQFRVGMPFPNIDACISRSLKVLFYKLIRFQRIPFASISAIIYDTRRRNLTNTIALFSYLRPCQHTAKFIAFMLDIRLQLVDSRLLYFKSALRNVYSVSSTTSFFFKPSALADSCMLL